MRQPGNLDQFGRAPPPQHQTKRPHEVALPPDGFETKRMRMKSNKEAAMELKLQMAGGEKSVNDSANGTTATAAAESSSAIKRTSDSSTPAEALADRTLRRKEKKQRKKELLQGGASEPPARPLIILDLNGILCHRIRDRNLPQGTRFRRSVANVANTDVVPRSDLREFLELLHRNFTLAVWTSATYKTAKKLVRALFPEDISRRLAFVWSRSYCDLIEKSEDSKRDEKGGDSMCDDEGGKDDGKLTDAGFSKQGSEDGEEGGKDYFRFDVFYESLCSIEKFSSKATSKVETPRGGNDRAISSDTGGKTEDMCNAREKTAAPCNKKGEEGKKLSHEDVTAMKSLSKVWAAYPRWNASNTILIDDSPEKIPIEHRSNVLHPPPIRGTETSDSSKVTKDDDELNQTTQTSFFTLLAKHWDEPMASAKDKLVAFLEEHADSHSMGWEKGLVS